MPYKISQFSTKGAYKTLEINYLGETDDGLDIGYDEGKSWIR